MSLKDEIKQRLMETGAVAVGFSYAGEIDKTVSKQYQKWIEEGYHGDMGYLNRHSLLKRHTDSVLPQARTVISVAFNYTPETHREKDRPYIAEYAYGDDYHLVLKELLNPVISDFKARYGGKWRLCIDSAPISERYWAMRSGIGIKGLNGSIIIDKYGSRCFLAEILTTLEIESDTPSFKTCIGCKRCIKICPAQAIREDGILDGRKCINYLTIEKKGDLNDDEKRIITSFSGFLYGCDRCMEVCPHNNNVPPTKINGFKLRKEIKDMTPEQILVMTEQEFKTKFLRSPLLYAGYEKLRSTSCQISEKIRH